MKINKNLKRCLSVICIMAIMLSTLPPVSARAKVNDMKRDVVPLAQNENVVALANKYNSTPQVIDEDTVFIALSTEENINYLADTNNISYTKAKMLINDKNLKAYASEINSQGMGTMSLPHYDQYADVTGIILKRFNVVSGISTTCTVVAAINVLVRIYWEVAYNARQFLTVYDTGITMDESGVFSWSTNSKSAPIMSNGFINLNASGTISGEISTSVSGSYKAANFTIGVSVGTKVYVNKFQTISYKFDPEFPGGILN